MVWGIGTANVARNRRHGVRLPGAFSRHQSAADDIITMCGSDFRQGQMVSRLETVAGGIDKTTVRDHDPAGASSFDRFHRASTRNNISRHNLDRTTRTLDECDTVVNITNNPVRDQLRPARGGCKISDWAGNSLSGGILGQIYGVAAPAGISLAMRVFKRRLCWRSGNLPLFLSDCHS